MLKEHKRHVVQTFFGLLGFEKICPEYKILLTSQKVWLGFT